MEKNIEHLRNLFDKNQLRLDQQWAAEQAEEELRVVVDRGFGLLEDMTRQRCDPRQGLGLLQFFHTWVFYYLYSADHKFIMALLKHKFPFTKLFCREISKLTRSKKNH